MDDALLANVVLVLHFFYAGFVVFGFAAVGVGAVLGWSWVRNRKFRIAHLIAIAIVGIETVAGLACPLTVLEYSLRRGAGLGSPEETFIGRIVSRMLYYDLPAWVFATTNVALALLAVALMFWVRPSRPDKRKRRAPSTSYR